MLAGWGDFPSGTSKHSGVSPVEDRLLGTFKALSYDGLVGDAVVREGALPNRPESRRKLQTSATEATRGAQLGVGVGAREI